MKRGKMKEGVKEVITIKMTRDAVEQACVNYAVPRKYNGKYFETMIYADGSAVLTLVEKTK